jgi:hypothetical protein
VARRWFPFSGNDVQMGLALLGAVVTALSLADVPSVYILWGSIGGAAFLYLAGLIVHSAGTGPRVTFLRGVAERGEGYIDAFRSVKRCLYLMHLDDDPPGAELQALYRVLLQRGVQIRRLIVVRKDASSLAYQWIVDFGDHENLQHAVVVAEQASLLHMGFVLVDDSAVLLSVPGHEAIDGRPYSDRLVLRHLLRVDDAQVAGAFLRIHEDLWARAAVLKTSTELPSILAKADASTSAVPSARGSHPGP